MYVTQTVGDEVKLYKPALNSVTKHKFANMNLSSNTSLVESLSILRYIDEKNSLKDACENLRETIKRTVESRSRFEEKFEFFRSGEILVMKTTSKLLISWTRTTKLLLHAQNSA